MGIQLLPVKGTGCFYKIVHLCVHCSIYECLLCEHLHISSLKNNKKDNFPSFLSLCYPSPTKNGDNCVKEFKENSLQKKKKITFGSNSTVESSLISFKLNAIKLNASSSTVI